MKNKKFRRIINSVTAIILVMAVLASVVSCAADQANPPVDDPAHTVTTSVITETVSGEPLTTTDATPATPSATPSTAPSTAPDGTSTVPSADNGAKTDAPVTDGDPAPAPNGGTEQNPSVTDIPETNVLHTHSYASEITKSATCTETGVKTFTCDCGDSYTDTIPATGHSYTKTDEKTTTSTDNGATVKTTVTTYTCSACRDSYSDTMTETVGEAHTHSYTSKVTKAATCTAGGTKTFTCACGDSYTEDIPATGHSYKKSDEKTSTATVGGKTVKTTVTTYTCSSCKDSYSDTKTETIGDAHTHSYTSKVTKAATCTAGGTRTYTCSCGNSYTETIPAAGHTYQKTKTVASTETEQGYTLYTCKTCGNTYKGDFTPVKPHTHSYTSKVTKEATCTATGTKTYTCSCGSFYTQTIPATGHSYSSKVTKEAACTANGVKTYTCSKCSNSYTETIPATGHSYTTKVVAPTEFEQGYTLHTCSKCNDSYKSNYTPATHKHSYTSKVTKEAGCETVGTRTYTCKCGDSYTESIAKTGHDWKTTTVHHDEVYETREDTKTYIHKAWYSIYHVTKTGAAINFNRDTFKDEALELGLTDLYNAIVNKRIGTGEQLAAVDPLFAKWYNWAYPNGKSDGCGSDYSCYYHIYVTTYDAIYYEMKPLCFNVTINPGETAKQTVNIDDEVTWLFQYSSPVYFDVTCKDGVIQRGYELTDSFPYDMIMISLAQTPPRSNNSPSYIRPNWTGTPLSEMSVEVIGSESYVATSAYDETTKKCTVCGMTDHTHNYTSSVTKEATCTTDGTRTYKCSDCSSSYTETIPRHHTSPGSGTLYSGTHFNDDALYLIKCKVCGEHYLSNTL